MEHPKMTEITRDDLLKLCKEAYESGQVEGIKLACDQISRAIQEFKTIITNKITTETK